MGNVMKKHLQVVNDKIDNVLWIGQRCEEKYLLAFAENVAIVNWSEDLARKATQGFRWRIRSRDHMF